MFRIQFRNSIRHVLLGALLCLVFIALSAGAVVYSGSTQFCISCHEMKIVAEQGWMKSRHYSNDRGIVAQCSDCHIEPELLPMFRTKTRDGFKDMWVHTFGESDPYRMDWEALEQSARKKISDSACRRCHQNPAGQGTSIKMIIAHREAERMQGKKRCVDCHRTEFHGRFRQYLKDSESVFADGGER